MMEQKSNFKAIINDIIIAIHKESDFEKAANFMIEHNLTIENIVHNTYKLSIFDIAKLCDTLINKVN